ncbi:MAG: prepilin peptidase [Elusimicrobia bacterium]|nr:prepilin peptidase [Elusimicrobiota bacterium]
MEIGILILIFILGLCFGSFANVCIYRIPRNLNITNPPSYCVSCKSPVKWRDNLPIIGYLLLLGRCRGCGKAISPIYPIVEISCALLFCLLYVFYGLSVPFFLFCILAFALIVISGIDLEFQIIPDTFSLGLIAAGLVFSVFNYTLGVNVGERLLGSAFGIIAGGGFLLGMGVVGKIIFKKDAMGGGDIKLMAGVGACIGFERVLAAMFIASLLASVVGIFLIIGKKVEHKGYIPFGPYLAAGSLATLFLPSPWIMLNFFVDKVEAAFLFIV